MQTADPNTDRRNNTPAKGESGHVATGTEGAYSLLGTGLFPFPTTACSRSQKFVQPQGRLIRLSTGSEYNDFSRPDWIRLGCPREVLRWFEERIAAPEERRGVAARKL